MSAVVIPEGLEPLGAWDMGGGFETWTVSEPEEAAAWLFSHLGPSAHVARVEFYVLDAAFAVAYSYEGESVITPLAELPPERLLPAGR